MVVPTMNQRAIIGRLSLDRASQQSLKDLKQIVDKTLSVINTLESEGVIGKYAIGGAVGLLFYAEPAVTYDLDIFCFLPHRGILVDLGPLYNSLKEKGYYPSGEHVEIEGVPVQFLPPTTELVREAIENAAPKDFAGIPTRVFQYEHLLAIMAQTGRPKDRARITQALESLQPGQSALNDILKRHNLLDTWTRIVS
jgi:hypothetical protein